MESETKKQREVEKVGDHRPINNSLNRKRLYKGKLSQEHHLVLKYPRADPQTTTDPRAQRRRGYVLFDDFEMVQLVTYGLQVALLGQVRQQALHAAVELVFVVKLGRERKRERG